MKKVTLILLCFAMICGSSACNNVDDGNLYKNYDESIEKETETSNISTISSDEYNPSEREVLEELAATRCTLDGFKQKFSNYRFISDNNDYCVLKTDSFTNTYFGFKRISGENGFSKFVLESISAPADVLLPEFLDLSFEEIEDKFEHSFKTPQFDDKTSVTSNLYLYKENFFYEIRRFIHGEKLTEEAVFIYPYSETYLPMQCVNFSALTKPSDTYKDILETIVSKRISLEEFNKVFTQNDIRIDGKYVFVSVDEFLNVEFCFKQFTDSIHGRSEYLIYSVTGKASILLPKYVGQNFFYLNQETGIFEFIHNSLDIVSYEENCSYKIYYDNLKGYNKLEDNIEVTLLPYTDTWVRPW